MVYFKGVNSTGVVFFGALFFFSSYFSPALPKLPEVVSYGGWDYTLINCGGFYGGLF
jgi:hypothetical protein